MATSSWEKNFYVPEEKADEFFEEMTREVPPTLTKDFKSQSKQGKEAKEYLAKIGEALENEGWNPLTKNFALNEEQTKRLLEAMEEPPKVVEYDRNNNRLKEGRELLAKLSKEFGKTDKQPEKE